MEPCKSVYYMIKEVKLLKAEKVGERDIMEVETGDQFHYISEDDLRLISLLKKL